MAKDDAPMVPAAASSLGTSDIGYTTDRQNEQSYHNPHHSDLSGQGSSNSSPRNDDTTSDIQPRSLHLDTAASTTETPVHASNTTLPQYTSTLISSSMTTQSDASSSTSPTSPRKRDRGYSLRTQLFQRNAQIQPAEQARPGTAKGADMELRPVSRAGMLKNAVTETIRDLGMSRETSNRPRMHIREPSEPSMKGRIALRTNKSSSEQTWTRKIEENMEKFIKFVFRVKEIPPSKDGRKIPLVGLTARTQNKLVDERTNSTYINNTIRSSRYTIYSFLPRQLVAQFGKLANFYFLCVAILQMIPNLSTTGTYTTIVPLLIFVSISMGKEGFDDYRRYKQDKIENRSKTRVLSSTTSDEWGDNFEEVQWQEIRVGDVVKLVRDDSVPADLVLLNTDGMNGIAYVETAALDGETNLKGKQALPSVADRCQHLGQLAGSGAEITVEDPNNDLYNFEGKVTMHGETRPLTNGQVLYRGSIIRNTPSLVGLVIFTGEETKIRMNANKRPRTKAPALQFAVNRVVVVVVAFVLLLATYHTIAYILWKKSQERKAWYLEGDTVPMFQVFTSFLIMFNTLIPLSLYVSLEIIKLGQMLLMNDIDMYHEASDTPMEARTSTINEELGQVSYIFTDKTGTLTDNSMIFRKVSIAGYAWLHDMDINLDEEQTSHIWHKRRHRDKGKKKANNKPEKDLRNATPYGDKKGNIPLASAYARQSVQIDNLLLQTAHTPRQSVSAWRSSAVPDKQQPQLTTSDLIHYVQTHPHTLYARKARLFLLGLSLCHTCLPEQDEKSGEITYQAASPDETALVQAAKELDYIVVDRQIGTITLKTYPNGKEQESHTEVYQVLDVIEFSSKRKRMSIILRFPDGKLCIFSKGADSTMVDLLRKRDLAHIKTSEIQRKAKDRRSLDAQEAIRRSMHRPSIAGGRVSFGDMAKMPFRQDRQNSLPMAPFRPNSFERRSTDAKNGTTVTTRYDSRFSIAIGEATSPLERDTSEDIIDDKVAGNESQVFERCFQHVQDFSVEGLRTLLYGYRYLDEAEYTDWKTIYSEATTSLVDRQTKIELAAEKIECNFEMLGATAIEDKLQLGVPEAIDKLRRANIKLWMLTGDKRETAINIGHSCRLIRDYSHVTILDKEKGNLEVQIEDVLDQYASADDIAHTVIVVDGATLVDIDNDEILQSLFFSLTVTVDTVICCRASPSQKASLVSSIRRKVNGSITLAIGDGANDIAMIQEAHVGIGITGKEGLAAARSSDYSIAQFRFLLKLLLVHGRWNYVRTSKYVLATFWKEMLFYLTQAAYQRLNGYTGTSLYEPWSISMFNTLFTSLPVIFLGVFEKDLAASTLLAVPELYVFNHRNIFNVKSYVAWIFRASTQAVMIFYITLAIFQGAIWLEYWDLFPLGCLTFTAVVVYVSTKLQILEMHNKSIMAAISFFCCVGGWFLWNILLNFIYHDVTIYDVKYAFFQRFGRQLFWWMTLLIVIMCCLIFDLSLSSLRVAFWPNEIDDFQAIEQDPFLRKRLEEAASDELQQGWNRGKKKTSDEVQREAEIEDLLNQPRIMVYPDAQA